MQLSEAKPEVFLDAAYSIELEPTEMTPAYNSFSCSSIHNVMQNDYATIRTLQFEYVSIYSDVFEPPRSTCVWVTESLYEEYPRVERGSKKQMQRTLMLLFMAEIVEDGEL